MIENKQIKKLTMTELHQIYNMGFRNILIYKSSLLQYNETYYDICLQPFFISITKWVQEEKNLTSFSSVENCYESLVNILEDISNSQDNYECKISGDKAALRLICQNNETKLDILKEEVLHNKSQSIILHDYTSKAPFREIHLNYNINDDIWRSRSGGTLINTEDLVNQLMEHLQSNWIIFKDKEKDVIRIEIHK